MKTTCPHCGGEVETFTKEVDQYGFVKSSKGSFIAHTVSKAKKGLSLVQLITTVDETYPNKNNIGRIQSVINKMKKAGLLTEEAGVIKPVAQ